eukprot:CAMPEP_0197005608 /NCGR_PEP_ID=MMETSP1380-20130617/30249_1 /TAXON_ID=5936 /ORGANISM="Euplotes crassus, Strain CT5" /LENGTH=74 /DNA_ID=CAMNT_0042424803 /DNA_START=149 /DNA_END=373 /DNA_ORIENTATION=+
MPYIPNPYWYTFEQRVCFNDCLNINLENGPKLTDLGEIPEGSIPKKFLWTESPKPLGYVEPKDDDDEDEDEDDE